MQVTRDRTERPRGALLQPDIECWYSLYRIGRSLGNRSASFSRITTVIQVVRDHQINDN